MERLAFDTPVFRELGGRTEETPPEGRSAALQWRRGGDARTGGARWPFSLNDEGSGLLFPKKALGFSVSFKWVKVQPSGFW